MKPVVRVNCILPGPMETPLLEWLRRNAPLGPQRTQELLIDSVPLKRLGQPSDFAALACFLASDASSFITGCTIATMRHRTSTPFMASMRLCSRSRLGR
jgi:NAD(P)-dependent dehydrogenase (short-subunit alcohol dehydrogenase family)